MIHLPAIIVKNMKTLIVHNSIHNKNTEKIAKAMADELDAELIKPLQIDQYNLEEYDLIGLGSGIYFGKHHVSILKLADELKNVENKRFFIFSTSGMGPGFFNNFNRELEGKLKSKKVSLVGNFNCRGFRAVKHIGVINKEHPDEKDVESARQFANGLKPKVLTLCLARKDNQILLGMKKRGFGEGRWNGFGGKVESGETIIDAAKRELEEESGLKALELKERGAVDFHFLDTGKVMEVHIFNVLRYDGEVIETEEMRPQWFDVDKIPFEKMWPDDICWMPMFLNGNRFGGKCIFENSDKIIDNKIKIIE